MEIHTRTHKHIHTFYRMMHRHIHTSSPLVPGKDLPLSPLGERKGVIMHKHGRGGKGRDSGVVSVQRFIQWTFVAVSITLVRLVSPSGL